MKIKYSTSQEKGQNLELVLKTLEGKQEDEDIKQKPKREDTEIGAQCALEGITRKLRQYI